MYLSALIEIGLALFLVTIVVNALRPPAGVGGDARRAGEGALMAARNLAHVARTQALPDQHVSSGSPISIVSGLAVLATDSWSSCRWSRSFSTC